MSHHIVHVFTHGAMLRQERGMLTMRNRDADAEKQLPVEDILALIIAAHGVTFSSDLLSELAAAGTVVIHCGDNYRPVALTAPLARTVRSDVVENQANRDLELHQRLWRRIVRDKIRNQLMVLQIHQAATTASLRRIVKEGQPDEAAAARQYWRSFFALAGCPDEIRDQDNGSPVNGMLNYGYAVLQAIVHRSIVAHGMIPVLGFHHASKYAGEPLVYDLMEPFRPFVDLMLLRFLKSHPLPDSDFQRWARHVAADLVQMKMPVPQGHSERLLYGMDSYIGNIANCLGEKSVTPYWEVQLERESLQNGLDHDDV